MTSNNSILPQAGDKSAPSSSQKLPLLKRVVRWLVIAFVVFFIADNVLLPIGLGFFATRKLPSAVGNTPNGFEAVHLTTADEVSIAAWYAAPQNGAAIILIHGAGGSRASVQPLAEMLLENGFGVLTLDLRGHGESGGHTNQFGWGSLLDVGAAVDFLSTQNDVHVMGGLGSSLGGETLLGAMSTYPALEAVVADGATQRSFAEFYDLPAHRNPIRSFSPWITFAATQFFSGDTPPSPTILTSIRDAEGTPLLLIAAGNDGNEVDYNTMFAETAGERAELWVAPEVNHTGAFGRYPDEYEQRVIGFFEAELIGKE